MTEPKSLISIILPVADNEQTLAATIESVLAQTHTELELLIINDGSGDDSVSIINLYSARDPRLNIIHRAERSGGPARPRNLGLERANGEFLAFIDADDLWHAQKLETQLKYLKEMKLDFISTDCVRFRSKGPSPSTIEFNPEAKFSSLSHKAMLRKNKVITSSMLVKTALFQDIGFNEDALYIGVEDYLAWLNLLQKPNIKGATLHLPLVFYRLRPDSLSSSKLKMAKKIYGLLNNYTINGRKLGLKRFYYFLCYAAIAIKNRIG